MVVIENANKKCKIKMWKNYFYERRLKKLYPGRVHNYAIERDKITRSRDKLCTLVVWFIISTHSQVRGLLPIGVLRGFTIVYINDVSTTVVVFTVTDRNYRNIRVTLNAYDQHTRIRQQPMLRRLESRTGLKCVLVTCIFTRVHTCIYI